MTPRSALDQPRLRRLALATTVVVAAALMPTLAGPTVQATPAERGSDPSTERRSFVVWDSRVINPGGKIRAHGKVPGGKRKVALQVKVKRGWQTIDTTRSNRKGKFRVAGRLDWYGKHKARVIAPARRPFVSTKRVTVLPPYTPVGNRKDFAYIHGGSVRQNYRFNPCQKISYRINIEDVGPAAKRLIKAGIAQLSWATGLEFRYVGKSKLIPYNMGKRQHYPRGTDLVIAFATHAEVPDFVRRSAAGFGGPRWVHPARNSSGQRAWMTTEAGVTLSTDYWHNGFAQSYFDTTRATIGELILHEIGHAVGLGHVPAAPQEIMNGRGYYRYPDGYYRGLYNLGDLNGLTKVGLKQGCLRPVRGGRVAEVEVPDLQLP